MTSNIPDTANAVLQENIDAPTPTDADPNVFLMNDNRLGYDYTLIKNDGDFDYKYDQGELQTFANNMKLKFFSRNPNDETIEIAIANFYAFPSVDNN